MRHQLGVRILVSTLLIVGLSFTVLAKGTYQEPVDFISETFDGNPPLPRKLWITKHLQEDIQKILDRRLKTLRLRYWVRDGRYAYILEEIGKEKPITVGLVVNSGVMEELKILVFREVRGWEVRYPFFTDQFKGAALTQKRKLDRKIDGVSGATLSVHAVKKLARLALFLYQHCSIDSEKS